MTSLASEISPRSRARVTGLLYLVIIACGLYSELYVRAGLIVRGDAEATAGNILASEWLFRLGFASDLAVFLSDVAVAVLLYMLLRPVSRTLALMAMAFRLVGTAIYGVNLLNYLAALLILAPADYLTAFEPGQLHALALWLLDVHRHGYDLGLVFFGLHCLLLGWLLIRSDYFPGMLGVLMVLASLGYLAGSLTLFLFPDHEAAVAPVYAAPLVAELALCLWLLIRGVKVPPGE